MPFQGSDYMVTTLCSLMSLTTKVQGHIEGHRQMKIDMAVEYEVVSIAGLVWVMLHVREY